MPSPTLLSLSSNLHIAYSFAKYLIKWKPIPMIIGSIIFANILAFRQYVPQSENDILGLFLGREGWMLFLGWISYFYLDFIQVFIMKHS